MPKFDTFAFWFYCYYSNANQMPDNVRDAVKEIIQDEAEVSEDDADVYIKTLEQIKRFQIEAWSWWHVN